MTKAQKARLLQGVILKCIDGRWLDGDGLTPPDEMLVVGITHAIQCWGRDNDLLDYQVEQANEPLPDVEKLNEQIPQKEWGVDLNNKPRPPWQFVWVVYLIDPETASSYTFINSTTGARIAVERLEERIRNMRILRGCKVAPFVKLDSRQMKTSFGTKMRPEFTIIDWRDIGPGAAPMLEHSSTPMLEHKPEQDDFGPPKAAAEPVRAKKATVGKPVKPVSVSEELNDALPGDLAPPQNPLAAG